MKLTDNFVKGVFDNIRNFVLSSLVIAIAVITLRDNYTNDQDLYLYSIGGIILSVGFLLFSLNTTHAWKKLDEFFENKPTKITIMIVYALIAIEFVRVLWTLRVDA